MGGHRTAPSADAHFYCATKYAVTALTEGIRQELREANTHIRATVSRAQRPSVLMGGETGRLTAARALPSLPVHFSRSSGDRVCFQAPQQRSGEGGGSVREYKSKRVRAHVR